MLLLVPARYDLPAREFLDLWKALIQVKAHTRKDGTRVKAHDRNVQTRAERKDMVAALAARMAGGEHTRHQTLGSALGAARGASKANGKAAHVYEHPEGGWVATHDATHTEGHVERIVVTKGRAVHHDAKGKQRSLKHIRGPIAEGTPPAVTPKVKPAKARKQAVTVGAKLTGEQRATVDRLLQQLRTHGAKPVALVRSASSGLTLLYDRADGTRAGTTIWEDGGTFALGVHGLPQPDEGSGRLLEDYRGKEAPAGVDAHGLTDAQRTKLDELVARAKAKGYKPGKVIRGADGHVRLTYADANGAPGALVVAADGNARGLGPAGARDHEGDQVLHDHGGASEGAKGPGADLLARAAAAGVKVSKAEQRAIAAGGKVFIGMVEKRIAAAEAKSGKKPGGQPGNDNAKKDGPAEAPAGEAKPAAAAAAGERKPGMSKGEALTRELAEKLSAADGRERKVQVVRDPDGAFKAVQVLVKDGGVWAEEHSGRYKDVATAMARQVTKKQGQAPAAEPAPPAEEPKAEEAAREPFEVRRARRNGVDVSDDEVRAIAAGDVAASVALRLRVAQAQLAKDPSDRKAQADVERLSHGVIEAQAVADAKGKPDGELSPLQAFHRLLNKHDPSDPETPNTSRVDALKRLDAIHRKQGGGATREAWDAAAHEYLAGSKWADEYAAMRPAGGATTGGARDFGTAPAGTTDFGPDKGKTLADKAPEVGDLVYTAGDHPENGMFMVMKLTDAGFEAVPVRAFNPNNGYDIAFNTNVRYDPESDAVEFSHADMKDFAHTGRKAEDPASVLAAAPAVRPEDRVKRQAKPAEPPSGKKPGGQPGNDNAAKDGAPDPAATAAHDAKRQELAAAVKKAEAEFTAFRWSPAGASSWSGENRTRERELWDAVLAARKALARHDHPEKEQTGDYRDVGEKIGAARKDTWAAVEKGEASFSAIDWDAMEAEPDQAAKLINKATLLQQSSPAALREAGMPANVAFLVTQVFNTIATKPADSHAARKAYAKGTERLQRALMQTRDFKGVMQAVTDIRNEARGYAVPDDVKAEFDRLKQASTDAYAGYRAARDAADKLYQALKAHEIGISEVKYNRRMKDPEKAKQLAALEPKKAEAEKAWRAALDAVKAPEAAYDAAGKAFGQLAEKLKAADRANPESWHNAFAALGDRFENMLSGKGVVWEKHNAHAQRKIGEGDWSWAEDKERPQGEKKEGANRTELPNWERVVPEEVEREGGADLGKVTPDVLRERFGLRAVEYGNYVNQAEAEHHTTRCAEAFADLSAVLGLDPKQVSYNGRLAMAFGARGKGHGLAHYESERKVINMTKFAGGGSLAHEWGHFLDNILTVVGHGGKGGHHSFLSDGVDTHGGPELPAAVGQAYRELIDAMHRGSNRAGKQADGSKAKRWFNGIGQAQRALEEAGGDAQKAMDALLDYHHGAGPGVYRRALTPQLARDYGHYLAAKTGQAVYIEHAAKSGMSDFKFRASQMGKSEDNYWTRGHEMFARAWESFVEDKLEAKGMRNSYLVSGTSGNRHEGSRKASTDAYPQGEERARINAAFEKLLAAVKDNDMLSKALHLGAAGLA